jgi:hypothetical protein
MADNPQTSEADVAIYIGSQIAGSLIGGAADQLITGPVLSSLGITKSDDSAAQYFQKISAQLAALGQSLNDQVSGLHDSLDEIRSIASEIQEYQRQEALAQVLREYNNDARTIQSLFELFVDDVSAVTDVIASTTSSPTNNAITDLYSNVLTADNAVKVSDAMGRIYDLLVKPTNFDKGIFDYLNDIVTAEIQKYAETSENYLHTFKLTFSNRDQLPRDFQYYDCGQIVVKGHDLARAELPTIAALFKRIVAIQLRGLIFLAKAWQESPHARTLGLRTNEVIKGISLMKAFYPAFKATVEKAIADSLKTSGKHLPDEFLHHFKKIVREDFSIFGNPNDPGGFLNHDWIMMRIVETEKDAEHSRPFDRVYMVYQPWTEASKLPPGADRYTKALTMDLTNELWFGGTALVPNFAKMEETGSFKQFDYHTYDRAIYSGLNQLPDDAPAEFASVLDGLPGSVDDALGTRLSAMLDKAGQGMSLSFKCALDGQDAVWLQGHPATGEVRLATRRGADGSRSTAWAVYSSQTGAERFEKMTISCLGFAHLSRHYLNESQTLELGAPPLNDLIKLGGAEWGFGPADFNDPTGLQKSNAVVIFSMRDFRRLEGHADGSVSLVPWTVDPNVNHGLLWRVSPYVVDADN